MDVPARDAEIAQMSRAYRPFVHVLLRALLDLGGCAPKKTVIARIRLLLAAHLKDKQIDYLVAKGRFAWVRWELKTRGLVGGEGGSWALTDEGREYVEAYRDDEIVLDSPERIPELGKEQRAVDLPREAVEVTANGGYEIPLLQVMSEGITRKKEINVTLLKRFASDLLPGDKRMLTSGQTVMEYRCSWALTGLGQAGEAFNYKWGHWRITKAGRERLRRESKHWDLKKHQNARASVLPE
jgi:restriction endonuclease Mrr